MTDAAGAEALDGFPFGPFHRLEDGGQTPEVARQQVNSGEIWGREEGGTGFVRVKAHNGSLPAASRGVEFWAAVRPDAGASLRLPDWTPQRDGVAEVDGTARIRCFITRNTQV